MNHASKTAVILASLAILAAWGCGEKPPAVSSSSQEASVKGTVTINGTPATGGKITFDPANINRRDVASRSADIQKGGTYTITTLVGENMVTVDGPNVPRNNTTIVVQSGDNNVPIDVK